ncbi:hypothetical protein GQ44DRAFT_710157 [Phaeosphaeriaceae sp. PMI808]|nr:hypothetical protein GQ44DRAFT_710157 [Phaeosphaeriaceae sp. PMI808]
MPQPHINSFYFIWFTIVDPVSLFLTALGCICKQEDVFKMTIPRETLPYDPQIAPLLYQIGTLFGFMGVIFAVLLRASPDPKVWRIVQAAVLAVDCSLLIIFYVMLRQQERLSPDLWRPIEWFNSLYTICVAIIRVGFLKEFGGGEMGAKKKS